MCTTAPRTSRTWTTPRPTFTSYVRHLTWRRHLPWTTRTSSSTTSRRELQITYGLITLESCTPMKFSSPLDSPFTKGIEKVLEIVLNWLWTRHMHTQKTQRFRSGFRFSIFLVFGLGILQISNKIIIYIKRFF